MADELDLHGMTVDESMPLLDQFLYHSYQAGLQRVWIVHGKGTGILRQAVRRYLSTHPLVKEHVIADRYHGDSGATQVDLEN
ncbi:MAG: Smr/MutS family protein [Chloroflexota bacterium]